MPKPPYKFDVTVRMPFGEELTVQVELENTEENRAYALAGLEGMLNIAEEIGADGRKAAAAREHDLEAIGNDSDYLDAIDRTADQVEILSIRRAGETKRFNVDAQYEDDQPWNSPVMAVDESDAEWVAAWEMAIGSENHAKTPADFDNMLATMADYQMFWAAHEPVTKDELVALLAKLYAAVDTGDTAEAMNETRAALEKLEALPDATPAPSL